MTRNIWESPCPPTSRGGQIAQAFTSGADFLRNWPTNRPYLLLLDLQMPELSGVEVQRAFNRTGADVPVVIVTAYDSESSRAECLREGAISYLCKRVEMRYCWTC